MHLDNAGLHYHILSHIVKTGRAPTIEELQLAFGQSADSVIAALHELQAYHGVVLHPGSSEVWVMHPFATAPTNFWIESASGGWWGNCAWCSLGAAALLDEDVRITTTLGGESRQVVVEIKDGQVVNDNLFIHFPIPMSKAWDNVIYTCSTMLMFSSENEVDLWCRRHGLAKGDVQPIAKIWEFSKAWYGNHLNPDWVKWTVDDARDLFQRFGLTDSIWEMPSAEGRF